MSEEILNEEEEVNVITLTDENGKEVDFEYMDTIEYKGDEYVVLLPMDENASEVVILLVQPLDEEEEALVSINDLETLNAVYDIFKDKFKDVFTFQD